MMTRYFFSYNLAVSRIISDVFATDKPWTDFQNPGHTFPPIFPYFPWSMVIGSWWAKHVSQLMLTFHRRLTAPFLLGSMSIRLNSPTCHVSIDSWVCTMAWVRWPQTASNLSHLISMALFVLHKLILQTHMCSHSVGLDVWLSGEPSSTSILYVCEQRRLWR